MQTTGLHTPGGLTQSLSVKPPYRAICEGHPSLHGHPRGQTIDKGLIVCPEEREAVYGTEWRGRQYRRLWSPATGADNRKSGEAEKKKMRYGTGLWKNRVLNPNFCTAPGIQCLDSRGRCSRDNSVGPFVPGDSVVSMWVCLCRSQMGFLA